MNTERKEKTADEERFLSLPEAAKYLNVSKQTLYAKARSGVIRCYVPSDGNLKKRRKFRREDLDSYMTEG